MQLSVLPKNSFLIMNRLKESQNSEDDIEMSHSQSSLNDTDEQMKPVQPISFSVPLRPYEMGKHMLDQRLNLLPIS